mgnify:CR=1 FL=1
MIIPDVQMAINKVNNLGFTAFFNMIKDGRLNVVTAIKMIRSYLIVLPLQVMPLQPELFRKYQVHRDTDKRS